MANKVLKTLSNNIGFKILAVIFAFTLWITVYNLEDPTKTKTLTVNVTVTKKDIDNIRLALNRDEDDSYFDWEDPNDVGEAIETLIQEVLSYMV